MGRRKGSLNKINYRVPPTGPLSIEGRLELLAVLVVDRILADLRKVNGKEIKSDD